MKENTQLITELSFVLKAKPFIKGSRRKKNKEKVEQGKEEREKYELQELCTI